MEKKKYIRTFSSFGWSSPLINTPAPRLRCAPSQLLVLVEHLSVEGIDVVEFLVSRVLVAIDFIFDFASRCGTGNHALDIEDFPTFSWLGIYRTSNGIRSTYVTVIDVVGEKYVMACLKWAWLCSLSSMWCSIYPAVGSTLYRGRSDTVLMSGWDVGPW